MICPGCKNEMTEGYKYVDGKTVRWTKIKRNFNIKPKGIIKPIKAFRCLNCNRTIDC